MVGHIDTEPAATRIKTGRSLRRLASIGIVLGLCGGVLVAWNLLLLWGAIKLIQWIGQVL
ncbi:hypothetical protein [Aureimonas psammosilenae]|uniref:hypothetical protein n=1 Tax=Aureimonas psammosilenae TaxID=2495496 RepID=UPI001260F450|nr:hypothetical protein [Aureimonas psammosilenae]